MNGRVERAFGWPNLSISRPDLRGGLRSRDETVEQHVLLRKDSMIDTASLHLPRVQIAPVTPVITPSHSRTPGAAAVAADTPPGIVQGSYISWGEGLGRAGSRPGSFVDAWPESEALLFPQWLATPAPLTGSYVSVDMPVERAVRRGSYIDCESPLTRCRGHGRK